MGVSGLLTLLKSIQKPCHLRDFAGLTVGVDAYGWLHRGAVSCAIDIALGKPTTKYVDFAMHRVRMLYHFGVTPYIVFDGDHLPSKAMTEKERAERRQEAKRTGEDLLRMGKVSQAYQELQKAVDITPEMARYLIEELKRFKVQYVVAPFEADSQLAYLEKQGLIDAIISEDSDLLVFGAKTLLTKLDQYGECIMIKQQDFTACREVSMVGWTSTEFRRMAILSGCDYLMGIPKMGLKTAHRLVRKCKNVERVIQCAQLEGKFRVPPGYLAAYDQAEKTFLHQWVFCPIARTLVNLTPLEKTEDLADLPFIGELVDSGIAQGVADGSLNPMTKLPITIVSRTAHAPKRTSPLRPRLGKENSAREVTSKKIQEFFKPSRTPLAELDVNTLTPSPTQQDLLLQNQGRSWVPQHVGHRVIFSEHRPTVDDHGRTSLGRTLSAPGLQPSKRQRLCAGSEGSLGNPEHRSEERSRFFAAPEPSPSIERGKKLKRSKTTDIQIHSDDSIEEAMLAMPDLGTPSAVSSKGSMPAPKPKLQVFQDDGMRDNNESSNSVSAVVDLESQQHRLILAKCTPVEKIEVPTLHIPDFAFKQTSTNKSQSSKSRVTQDFSSSLQSPGEVFSAATSISEIQSLRSNSSCYAFAKRCSQSPETVDSLKDDSNNESSDAASAPWPQEPKTPPASLRMAKSEIQLPGPSSVVKETPHQIDGTECAEKKRPDHLDLSPSKRPSGPRRDVSMSTLKPKGSEDLLIVPDSDESSESGALSPSSPTEIEERDHRQRLRRTMDLSKFAFGATVA